MSQGLNPFSKLPDRNLVAHKESLLVGKADLRKRGQMNIYALPRVLRELGVKNKAVADRQGE